MFNITSFVPVKIMDVVLTGPLSQRHIDVQIVGEASSKFVVGDGAGVKNSMFKIRLAE